MGKPDCPDCQALLQGIAPLEARVRELEARLNSNSSNSSIPPSANPLGAPKPCVRSMSRPAAVLHRLSSWKGSDSRHNSISDAAPGLGRSTHDQADPEGYGKSSPLAARFTSIVIRSRPEPAQESISCWEAAVRCSRFGRNGSGDTP